MLVLRRVGRALLSTLAVTLPSVAAGQTGPNPALDSAVFVTRLGSDTLVIERMVRSPRRIEAEVAMRVPRTTRTMYVLELSPSGMLERMEATTFAPTGTASEPAQRHVIARVGDSLRVERTQNDRSAGAVAVSTVPAGPNVLPFIDMVHWPYEIALMRFRATGQSQEQQPLLSGIRISNFALARAGDSMTITHPTRGTMRVSVDASGRLLALDAGATTRKLVVERRPWMAIDDVIKRWAADDAAGRSLGALSGRARTTTTVGGATISLDYGTPSKRGRAIWGALVPFGQVWRTGANEATHFATDRDLVFGTGSNALLVPAGRYTLFSVPEREGGWLIINRQTGQTGTAYDQSQDLGRVRLSARPLATPVETFTIKADADGGVNLLRLQWDGSERVAPFHVRTPK